MDFQEIVFYCIVRKIHSFKSFLISKSTESEIRQQLEYKRLQSMVDYCHTPQCLRAFILHYFGEFDVEEHL